MGRKARVAPGGLVYHVFNRSAGRFKMFRKEGDYLAFQRVVVAAHQRLPLRILSYCVLATHWHFVVWPRRDGELSEFFRWLTHTHAMRWRVAHQTVGFGHLYGDRFKSFPVQTDEHLLTVCRYVERNALTAGLVQNAQDWKWGSLWLTEQGTSEEKELLHPWLTPRPADWTRRVNTALTQKELERLEPSLERGRPFGDEAWQSQTITRLGLEHTLRPEGRPAREGKRKTGTQLV